MSAHSASLSPEARALVARAAEAERRGGTRAEDVFLTNDERLDDHVRAAVYALVDGMAAAVERDLRAEAYQLALTRGDDEAADLLALETAPVVDLLAEAGVLRDAAFVGECLDRVRLELLSEALPAAVGAEADAPSLLARLARSSDRGVAEAARAAMIGENARRSAAQGSAAADAGLPDDLAERFAWWIAAGLAERLREGGRAPDAIIADACAAWLATRVDEPLEAAVLRLAAAIDAEPGELPALLEEALADRRLTLFAAFMAHALRTPFADVRAMLVDPAGERLLLALRAVDAPRTLIARTGVALAEADPARDVERFADDLDAVWTLQPDEARVALSPLALDPRFRAALAAIGGAR